MEENLNDRQVRPGDETQWMHLVFSSDEEMMTFYLALYRLMQPGSLWVQTTDKSKLEELERMLRKNIPAFEAVNGYKTISVKEVIKGLGMQMMSVHIPTSSRLQNADAVGNLMDCILGTTKNLSQFSQMFRLNFLHIENVKYLLKKLKAKASEEKEAEVAI